MATGLQDQILSTQFPKLKILRERFLVIGILALAFLVRIWSLDMKPPHFDEGINGHFVMEMWKNGFYRYDPTNFHGPLYFYVLQLAELLFGKGIFAFRFVTVLISVSTCWLMMRFRRFFGSAAFWAALVYALSPAAVFYARYAIHESLFIFFQVLFAYGFYLYQAEKSRTSVAYMVAGVAGSFMVKETFFIFFVTWLIACFVARMYLKIFAPKAVAVASKKEKKSKRKVEKAEAAGVDDSIASPSDIFAISFIGFLIVLTVFSGFFMHLEGMVDMVRAFFFWTKTGTSSGHEKPFLYWLTLMTIYEWPVLAALILTPLLYFICEARQRILVLTAFGTWLAYSLIPYKTPWLILNIIWPLSFVFGFAMQKAIPIAHKFHASVIRWLIPLAGLYLITISTQTMLHLNFVSFTDPSEKYVYVQSSMQFKHVMDWIQARVKTRPEDLNMRVLVLNKDTWPMPWTLSDFSNLIWGNADTADLKDAKVITIDAGARTILERRLHGKYFVEPFHIRDAYDDGWAFFEYETFKGIVPETSAVFESKEVNP